MSNSKQGKGIIAVFIFYLVLLVWVVLLKTQFSLADLSTTRHINLIPFYYEEETSGHLREVIDNVLIFIPFGIYMRVAFRQLPIGTSILIIALTSFVFETLQFVLSIGASDVTDIISNTMGAALGVALYTLLARIAKNNAVLDKVIVVASAVLMILAVAGAAFLLYVNQ
ncbi:VanZ family protein [Atopobium sp. oral taxon 810]|uniref:VanZ family protein n=1 Tax=Atopobium sp. oral taxon 810 TaxID=712158 RepID=UPI00039816F2|nr:VanZ family protein [Atopobium sp. oral taxon 810]ERI06571.1 VanZ-like protein [Atopobium sp. oral taxon 810 str. F0209]